MPNHSWRGRSASWTTKGHPPTASKRVGHVRRTDRHHTWWQTMFPRAWAVFSFTYERTVLMPDGSRRTEEVTITLIGSSGGWAMTPRCPTPLSMPNPSLPRTMSECGGGSKYIDSSISKTINCLPTSLSMRSRTSISKPMSGCKGCTTYRPNAVTGSVLAVKDADEPTPPKEAVWISPCWTSTRVARRLHQWCT